MPNFTPLHWSFFPALLHLISAFGNVVQPIAQNEQTPLQRRGTQAAEALTKLSFAWLSFWPGLEPCISVRRGEPVCYSLEWPRNLCNRVSPWMWVSFCVCVWRPRVIWEMTKSQCSYSFYHLPSRYSAIRPSCLWAPLDHFPAKVHHG